MAEMTQTQFYEWLGAPLRNIRQSWGSTRSDGTVFLRVWQDDSRAYDGKNYMRLTKNAKHAHESGPFGHPERCKQVELIRKGATCYLVMCEANASKLPKREVKSFNKDAVFAGGQLLEVDGDTWIEYLTRVPAESVRK